VFRDDRGYFLESFNARRYFDAGLSVGFVQDNLSFSKKGVLRGMHFQTPRAQAKLISVAQGEIIDVVVDVRLGSPTYARWHAERLSAENARQLFVPAGFAHGFLVLSESALVSYKCSGYHEPEDEVSLLWNDPDIGIEWPAKDVFVSERDAAGLRLAEIPEARLPRLD
jgi:dTDP-4-dehydrorhamnose 3,5-epimerase